MIGDTLANVSGREWLVAELRRIHEVLADGLIEHYLLYRVGRTKDRKPFVEAVHALKINAFLTAQAIDSGECDIREVLSILNAFHRLDVEVHKPDIVKGRHKTAEEYEAGFGSKHDDHERWVQAFTVALAELERAGVKRPLTKAAQLVIKRLDLGVTPGQVLRVIRETSTEK